MDKGSLLKSLWVGWPRLPWGGVNIPPMFKRTEALAATVGLNLVIKSSLQFLRVR